MTPISQLADFPMLDLLALSPNKDPPISVLSPEQPAPMLLSTAKTWNAISQGLQILRGAGRGYAFTLESKALSNGAATSDGMLLSQGRTRGGGKGKWPNTATFRAVFLMYDPLPRLSRQKP